MVIFFFAPPFFRPSRCHQHVNCETALESVGVHTVHLNMVDINADTDIDDPCVQVQRSGVIDDRVEVSVLC